MVLMHREYVHVLGPRGLKACGRWYLKHELCYAWDKACKDKAYHHAMASRIRGMQVARQCICKAMDPTKGTFATTLRQPGTTPPGPETTTRDKGTRCRSPLEHRCARMKRHVVPLGTPCTSGH
uniref:Uncharacterized protein n=1 Tax=Cannabis sativa TaxID=3483 RepID=A0A803QDM7_CANSA